MIDLYRTQKETMPLEEIASFPANEQTPAEEVEIRFSLQAMRDGLYALTDDQQQVLILKFIAGLPNDNIAKVMNKRVGAVRALQMRALQTLSKFMKEKELI